MLRNDLSPKPVYASLGDLIYRQWHTKAEGRTDGEGRFAFRGFSGRYEVTAAAGGKTVKVHFDLRRQLKTGKAATCLVALP